MEYEQFLETKVVSATKSGFNVDPFGGLMTVPLVAMKRGRKGIGIELNPDYFRNGVAYLKTEEAQQTAPTLFDFLGGGNEE